MTKAGNTLGRTIKRIRLSKGMTLEEFGKLFNTSKVTVYNWEIDRNKPNKENLKLIADIAGVSVEELLDKGTITAVPDFQKLNLKFIYGNIELFSYDYKIIPTMFSMLTFGDTVFSKDRIIEINRKKVITNKSELNKKADSFKDDNFDSFKSFVKHHETQFFNELTNILNKDYPVLLIINDIDDIGISTNTRYMIIYE